MAHFISVSTYMLYMNGKLLFDKAFMCEYTKLATCKLLSFIATLAMVVIKGRAGLVSKITAQAIIRTSGGSDWSARIWMRYPCTCREKPCLELPITETFCILDPHITSKREGRGCHYPQRKVSWSFLPHDFTKTTEGAMEGQPHGEGLTLNMN